MITYTSSTKDIQKEMKQIDRFLIEKNVKALKQYRNWIKNHRGVGNQLLGKSRFQVNNNNILCWWVGNSNGKNNILTYGWACETPNKDGKLRYLVYMPLHQNSDEKQTIRQYAILLFTHHFCQRLQERHGKSFLEWWEEGVLAEGTSTQFRHEEEGYYMLCNNTYCMFEIVEDNMVVVKTTINTGQQYANQIAKHLEMYESLSESHAKHLEWEKEICPRFSYSNQLKALRNSIGCQHP